MRVTKLITKANLPTKAGNMKKRKEERCRLCRDVLQQYPKIKTNLKEHPSSRQKIPLQNILKDVKY